MNTDSVRMSARSAATPDTPEMVADDADSYDQDADTGWRPVWRRFRSNRLGYASLLLFVVMLLASVFSDVIATDRPLIVRYDGHYHFPLLKTYADTQFGGDLPTPADYLDPDVRGRLHAKGSWAMYAPDHYRYDTINYYAAQPNPAPPSAENWLGTDSFGRDVFARVLYGFRTSIFFALALTLTSAVLGIVSGAVQGFFAGRVDLVGQRLLEIWNALPDLYLLIILGSIFQPSLLLLLVLLSMFGWIALSDYVRAEFLRNRSLEFVKAARTLGLTNFQIIWRHILPNSLTPIITYLPFRMNSAILSLTSLDFLGMGVPPPTPSLGELLAEGKDNLNAWWISAAAFTALVVTLLLLTFIGDALRKALDGRSRGAALGGRGR